MADKDVIQTLVTALENRERAIAEAAHTLLLDGEVEYAKIKTAVGSEFTALKAEIQALLAKA